MRGSRCVEEPLLTMALLGEAFDVHSRTMESTRGTHVRSVKGVDLGAPPDSPLPDLLVEWSP
jgi:hypothetical protein